MELTLQQRNEIYKRALAGLTKSISEDIYEGICNEIESALCSLANEDESFVAASRFISNLFYDDPAFESMFPEFIKHRPTVFATENYWFPRNEAGNLERIKILESCIELTRTPE